MNTILIIYRKFLYTFGMMVVIFSALTPTIHALTSTELNSLYTDTPYYDPLSKESCGAGTAPKSTGGTIGIGTKVYMLGDSISYQSQSELNTAFSAAGMVVTKLNADSGRAIASDTAPPGTSGLQAAADDQSVIDSSDVVVVALGTNSGVEDLNKEIPKLVSVIRNGPNKTDIPIYWVNLFYKASGGGSSRNTTIASLSSAQNYTVIDTANANIELGADQIHPSEAGRTTFANTVVKGLSGGGGTTQTTATLTGADDTPEDGNPLHVLTYPKITDEAAAATAIDNYIKAGWPSSPFVGLGKYFVSGGKKSNVNPFLAAGHLQQENGFATAKAGWHTLVPPTYNAFGATSSIQPYAIYHGSTHDYKVLVWPSWAGSLDSSITNSRDDWFMNIRRLYLNPGSTYESHDFATYIHHYAPGSDGNDEGKYIATVFSTMDKIAGSLGVSAGAVNNFCSASLRADSGMGAISTDGYAFPLAPQSKLVGGIVVGQTKTTHHDGTAAFDLFSTDSAVVYAIYGGTPTNVNKNFRGVSGCSSIQFKADDGFYYWYGHLKDVVVSQGTHITAGTPMAKIADGTNYTAACWEGTPHLHIDRGCSLPDASGKLVPQTAGRDECRDETFIPFLSKLYETLPT